MTTLLIKLRIAALEHDVAALEQSLVPARTQLAQAQAQSRALEDELARIQDDRRQVNAAHQTCSKEWQADIATDTEARDTHKLRAKWLMQLPAELTPMTQEQRLLLLLLSQRTASRTIEHGLAGISAAPEMMAAAKQETTVAHLDRFIEGLEAGHSYTVEDLVRDRAAEGAKATQAGAPIRPGDVGLSDGNYRWMATNAFLG